MVKVVVLGGERGVKELAGFEGKDDSGRRKRGVKETKIGEDGKQGTKEGKIGKENAAVLGGR